MSSAVDTQFSHTKEYEVGSGTIDLGRAYEYKMVALISLRCLLQDFNHVEIAFNAANLGALDDVIINAWRKEGNNIKILVQLKHEEKGKNLISEQFLGAKGNYSLLKYCDHILKLKEYLDCRSTQKGIIKDLGTFNNIYFVLFTNKGSNKHEFLNNDGCDAISFLNTNADNDNLYKFDLTKVSELSSLPQIDYNFYLFAKQIQVNHLEEMIETEMEKVFRHFGLTHSTIKNCDISKAFIEYVTDWSMGKLGGHHYLTKHAILYKLTDLLLKRFELDLSVEKFEFYDCPQKELWNEVVNDKRITIVDSDEEVIRFLKLYVAKEIWPYCQDFEKTWSCKFSKEEQSWFYKKYDNLKKAMLKVVGRNGKITLLSIYKCLWFNECLPLLIKINTLDDYEVILRILKLSEFKLKVIILTNIKLKPTGIELDYFATLSHLDEGKRLKILNNSVKLQGRFPVTLKELLDDSLCPFINCKAIINILMGNFNIGIVYKPLSEYFIDRTLLKVFLKMVVLKQVRDETFVIKIKENSDCNKSVSSKLEEFKCNPNVIIVDEHNPIQIEELKLQNKPIHRLVFDHNLLEWKESFGSTNRIKNYQIGHQIDFREYLFDVKRLRRNTSGLCNELEGILANINIDNYFNRVNLVSASPGMGKSTLLDRIASMASTEMWVLIVNLSDHDDYYDAKRLKIRKLTAQDHLKYFNDLVLKNCNCNDIQLAQFVFQKFINRKQVLVLLDAMDEVSISSKNEVIEIINCIHKAGFSVWLTTRPHLAAKLEETFATISTTLRPFSIDDQKHFLNKYFKHISKTLDLATNQTLIKEFVEKLLQAGRNNLNDRDGEFTGIPLQTKLIAIAFSDQLKESLRSGIIKFEVKFDLLHLYEEFLKRKDNILRDKFGKGAKDMRILFQNHQQLFALNLIFHTVNLFRLDIKANLYDYYDNNEEHIQFLQQDGVTVIQRNVNKEEKFQVHFVHRTFAEYLAALWLFNNFNGRCDNSKVTARLLLQNRYSMHTDYGLLFRMFDCMVAGDSQLHLSIINRRLDQALELITLNPDVKDMCERSFLHIIPLYATDRRTIVTDDAVHRQHINELSDVRNEMAEFVHQIPTHNIKNTKDILGYTPLDYALRNSSFTVANKLCEKSNELMISSNMLDLYDVYIENRWLINSKYETLLKKILPILIYQKLLLDPINHETCIVSHCAELFRDNIQAIKIIIEYTNELSVMTLSDLLVKMNIKSADTAQVYYYDLRFAAAFGSILNVQDLILSEYWTEQNNFYTPLYWAVKYDRLEIIKLLLFYGENINETCIRDRTSLHCAVQHGSIEIVRELLSYQADVNLRTNSGDTPLRLALCHKHIEIAKLLLAYNARVDIKDRFNCFPVYDAASNGLDDLIPYLINKGVDVNQQRTYGGSPLCVAIHNGHVNTIRVLLRCGADCNIPNKSNKFPMHSVAELGLDEVLPEILCKTLEGINVTTTGGQTALHFSVFEGSAYMYTRSNNYTNIVKFLLNNGANINIQDCAGNTALHYLCYEHQGPFNNGDSNIVAALLVNKGADVNLKNNDGNTPLLYLLQTLHEDDNPGHLYQSFSLLIHEDNVNIQDKKGNTALHYLFGTSELYNDYRKNGARLILNKGADVNIINNNGESSFHLFLHYLFTYDLIRQLSVLFPFIIPKANVSLQDNDGNAALHYCCKSLRFHELDKKIINLVLEKGADLNLKNKNGKTPLDLTHDFNLTEIVSLFQQHKQLDLTQNSHN